MGKVLMALVLYVIYKGVKEIRITLKKYPPCWLQDGYYPARAEC